MAKRSGRKPISKPVDPAAVARALKSISPAHPEHTCPLPPPSSWPGEIKRFVLAALGSHTTFDAWRRPFRAGSAEPMWLLLRSAGRRVRGGFKIITNDEAWMLCVNAARQRAELQEAAA